MSRSTPATIVETAGVPPSLFPLGQLVLTPAALRLLCQAGVPPEEYVCRHAQARHSIVMKIADEAPGK